MDLKKYELFSDVADSGNFTISGNKLGYTQSGVSHIIKGLENEFGFSLFVRTRRGVSLTDNGKTILPLIRQLLANNSHLEQTINAINGLVTGSITIGTYSSIAINWLPKIIYEFQKDFPSININIREGGIDEIESWIENSTVDFGFCSERNSQEFDWIPLKDDPLMAILPKDFSIPEKGVYEISDFQNQPFIIHGLGIDYDIHLALRKAKVTPCIHFSSTDDHTIISMVANHLGISILPNLIVKDWSALITALPLKPYTFRSLGIGVKSLKYLSPAAKKFIEYTKELL
ncbi:LysR family transcriptional regulator [Clostridium carboxidivorans P7]|uniref:Transcriptional regulator, LysR family n=1 Tax=Clostridium carboxidivorans P7 TaxID=536227 RepID=C6PSU8_9CLOT|nr:LysR family transcriptional regulator [Clostridium carboxidivorans]AKN30282.1 LysR family transcriptional regulator [Clostridium carboxidivorans P7]EET87687.1 transcriptional regulator, LysR family [Clostridium carboxidivorans P7]